MSLTKQVAHNSGLQIATKMISTVLGLIAVAIMTRALGAEKFGWYVTASSFMQFVGIFADFGFMLITSKMLAENEFEREKILNVLATWRIITAAIAYSIAIALIWCFPYQNDIKIVGTILSASFFFVTLNQVLTGYYQWRLKMIYPALGEIFGRIVLVVGVWLLMVGHKNIVPMMVVVTLGSLANYLCLLFKAPKIKFSLDKTISRAAYTKMWPTAVSIMFNSVYLLGDRLILPLYVNQEMVGFYGAAYRVLDIVLQVAALLMAIMLPLLSAAWSENNKTEYRTRFQLSFDLLALAIFPMITGTLALATPIMKFVAGPDFVYSGKILTILIIAIFGVYLGQIGGHLMLSINKQRQSMIIFLLTAVIGVISYFILIPKYGVWGAAITTIITEFFAGILLIGLSIKNSGCYPRLNSVLKILIASFLMAGAVYYIPTPHVLISVALGAIIYSGLILLFKAIKIETVKQILNRSI